MGKEHRGEVWRYGVEAQGPLRETLRRWGRARFQVLLDHFALELLAVPRFELAVLVVLELAFHGSLFGVNPIQDESSIIVR